MCAMSLFFHVPAKGEKIHILEKHPEDTAGTYLFSITLLGILCGYCT